ncbi:hypothetical protein T459_24599 [Capsicum annuum]|uniref:Uncharacterized protein n=1 Tax=Capsicum annuum TaxID=4072 RepID=A0A2G2YVT1_CAPAN|nr:hypothetical protein T459_24599 [Capsicum annuum]
MAFHERIESPNFGCLLIQAGPRPVSIGGPAHRHSTSNTKTVPRDETGSGHNEAHTLSGAPSRGLGLGPSLRSLLQTIIQMTEPPDSNAGLFLVRSPLLRESL